MPPAATSALAEEVWPVNLSASRELIVDSKAMRVVKPGQTLVVVTQYVNQSGNPQVSANMSPFRVLVGLH